MACFELDVGRLSTHPSRENRYQAVPELPDAGFDLSVVVADSVRWNEISSAVASADPTVNHIGYVDEFRGSWVPDGHRSLTLRVTLRPSSTTLTAEEIALTRTKIITALERELGGYLRESGESLVAYGSARP